MKSFTISYNEISSLENFEKYALPVSDLQKVKGGASTGFGHEELVFG